MKIIRELLTQIPHNKQTQISTALDFASHMLPRHSILILISDFLDTSYEKNLKRLAARHEVIAIRLYHPNEVFHTGAGIVPVVDVETDRIRWVNTGDLGFRQKLGQMFEQMTGHLEQFCRLHRIGYLSINTQEDYFPVLDRFFKRRSKMR